MRKLTRKPAILLAGLLLALLAFALPALAAPAHQAGQNRYRQAVFFVGHNEYFIKAERPKDMDTDPTVEGFVNEEGFRPMDAAPFVENGRTYVPVRYLALALGIRPEDIGWDANTGTVSMITQKEIRWFGFGPFLFPEGKLPEPLTVSDIMKALEVYDWSANLTEEDIIDWKYDDEKHQSVSGHCRIPPVIRLKLIIGNKTLLVNGQTKTMDVAPLIREGRTYLPARWVAEAFGYEVKWDEARRAVLVGNPPPPAPELPKRNLSPDGPIDLTAAKNGTLGVPENAVAPPSKWGFEPPICRMEFEVGNRYAKVWPMTPEVLDLQKKLEKKHSVLFSQFFNWQMQNNYPRDPSTGKLIEFEDWLKNHPDPEYNDMLTRLYGYAQMRDLGTEPVKDGMVLYVPFIPVAKAFGLPEQNIVWDGEHLGLWGYYGAVENYHVMTAGSKEIVLGMVINGKLETTMDNELSYPLFVKDGVPMVGMATGDDLGFLLFINRDGGEPKIVDGVADSQVSGFDRNTGKASLAVRKRTWE